MVDFKEMNRKVGNVIFDMIEVLNHEDQKLKIPGPLWIVLENEGAYEIIHQTENPLDDEVFTDDIAQFDVNGSIDIDYLLVTDEQAQEILKAAMNITDLYQAAISSEDGIEE